MTNIKYMSHLFNISGSDMERELVESGIIAIVICGNAWSAVGQKKSDLMLQLNERAVEGPGGLFPPRFSSQFTG